MNDVVKASRLLEITINTALQHEADNRSRGDMEQVKEYEKFIGWLMELKDMKEKSKAEVN